MTVMSKLAHHNVIEFMGFLYDEAGFLILISRWMDCGTALEYIKQHPEVDIHSLVRALTGSYSYLSS